MTPQLPSHHIAGYIGGGSASDNQNTSLSVEISTRKRPAVLYLHGNDDDLKSLRDLGFPFDYFPHVDNADSLSVHASWLCAALESTAIGPLGDQMFQGSKNSQPVSLPGDSDAKLSQEPTWLNETVDTHNTGQSEAAWADKPVLSVGEATSGAEKTVNTVTKVDVNHSPKLQGPKSKCNHNCYHQYLHKNHPDRGKACEIRGVACKGQAKTQCIRCGMFMCQSGKCWSNMHGNRTGRKHDPRRRVPLSSSK